MARTLATNFTATLQFPMASAATDLFKKEDVQTLALAVDQHDHTTGKGLTLSGVSGSALIDGTVTSAKIADGTIQAGDIADGTITGAKVASATITGTNITDGSLSARDLAGNAISQSYGASGSSANPTTTSASMADIPDMTIAFTAGGPDGVAPDLLIILQMTYQNTSISASMNIGASLDGVDAPTLLFQAPVANSSQLLSYHLRYSGVTPGAHTVKGRWSSSGGTMTAVSTARMLIMEEFRR